MSIQVTSAGRAGLGHGLARWVGAHYRPLETRREKRAAEVAGIGVLLGLSLILGPRMTGGRLGLVGVEGDSMAAKFPYGSCVLVAPCHVQDGDYVVAWAADYCDRENPNRGPALVVKQLKGGKLVSTSCPGCLEQFEVRGRVLCCLPVQKILRWRAEASSATPPTNVFTPELRQRYLQRQALVAQQILASQRVLSRVARPVGPRATNLVGFQYTGSRRLACGSSGGKATFVLANKPTRVYAVVLRSTCPSGNSVLHLGDREIKLQADTDITPRYLRLNPTPVCTKAELVSVQGTGVSNSGGCVVNTIEFWVDK